MSQNHCLNGGARVYLSDTLKTIVKPNNFRYGEVLPAMLFHTGLIYWVFD